MGTLVSNGILFLFTTRFPVLGTRTIINCNHVVGIVSVKAVFPVIIIILFTMVICSKKMKIKQLKQPKEGKSKSIIL